MFLSSFRIGDHPERLVALVNPPGPAAVIANALDADPDDVRRRGVQRELAALQELGFEADELDLRAYFGAPDQLTRELTRYQLAWLRGGNVFLLRSALAQSGADAVLADLLHRDALVYGGYSAGVCVLGPTLHGLETADDPDAVPATYGVPTNWDGMGVLEYTIVPHYQSPGHPATALMELVAQRYRAGGAPHQTLRDGQAIVIDSGDHHPRVTAGQPPVKTSTRTGARASSTTPWSWLSIDRCCPRGMVAATVRTVFRNHSGLLPPPNTVVGT